MNKQIKIDARFLVLAWAFFATPISTIGAEDGWSFSLGGGGVLAPVYDGAEENFIAAAPVAKASYTTGDLSLSASLWDGLGIQYLDMERRLFASANVNFGNERDDEEYKAALFTREHSRGTKEYLEGSPSVSSILRSELMLGWISPIGILGASLKYLPTTVEEDGDTDFYHAFLPSAFFFVPFPVSEKFSVTALVALQFMDDSYADAWYSVEEPTAELDEFEAEAGLQSVRFFLQVDYMFTKHIGASLFAENACLLKDAADSPYTSSGYQLSSGFYAFYKF